MNSDAYRFCNRTACRKPGATWWNTSTRAYYCGDCARRINEHAPGLCVEQAPAAPPSAPTPTVVTVRGTDGTAHDVTVRGGECAPPDPCAVQARWPSQPSGGADRGGTPAAPPSAPPAPEPRWGTDPLHIAASALSRAVRDGDYIDPDHSAVCAVVEAAREGRTPRDGADAALFEVERTVGQARDAIDKARGTGEAQRTIDSLATVRAALAELRAWRTLYESHADGCAESDWKRDGEPCTCGLTERRDKARRALGKEKE